MTDSPHDDTIIRTVRHASHRAASPTPTRATTHPRPFSGDHPAMPSHYLPRSATHPGTTPPSTSAPITELPDFEPAEHQPARPPLYTAEQAAALLQVRTSWLRCKATARAVPCRFLGKHLRFALADIHTIADANARPSRCPQHSPAHRTN